MHIYCIHENIEKFASRMEYFKKQWRDLNQTSDFILIDSFPASDFTEENQSIYNRLHLSKKSSEKSCFWKHYDALKKIAESNSVGLVLEDDAIFKPSIVDSCNALLVKLKENKNFYVNIEYDNVDVPIWFAAKTLVKAKATKRAGGYLVSPEAARKLCNEIESYLTNEKPYYFIADGFITEHWEKVGIDIYWSVVPLVWQGSKSGRFDSHLCSRKEHLFHTIYEPILFNITPTVNKIRACFRSKVKNQIIEAIQ